MFKNSTIVAAVAYLLGAVLLLCAWNGMAVPADVRMTCPTNLCRAYKVLVEFQTLIAAGIALVAAIYASQPVWRQVKKMGIQQEIMAREIIASRISEIERRFDKYYRGTENILNKIKFDYLPSYEIEDFDPSDINPEWAFNMEHETGRISTNLSELQKTKVDTELIEKARAEFLLKLDQLSNCLNSISAPPRMAGYEDITQEQEDELIKEAEAARKDMLEKAFDASSAHDLYKKITEEEIAKMRNRLRLIDDQILKEEE